MTGRVLVTSEQQQQKPREEEKEEGHDGRRTADGGR